MDVSDKDWNQLSLDGSNCCQLRETVPLFWAQGGGGVEPAALSRSNLRIREIILSNSLRAVLVNALKTVAQEVGPQGFWQLVDTMICNNGDTFRLSDFIHQKVVLDAKLRGPGVRQRLSSNADCHHLHRCYCGEWTW